MSALLDDAHLAPWPPAVPRPVHRPAALRLVVSNDLVEPAVVRRQSVSASVPTRLTRRGIAVLAGALAVLAAALVWFAAVSAPSSAGTAPAPVVTGDSVAVAPGDSLWSIAGRVAPDRDPRAEVAVLQRLNHLDGNSTLVPGQVLRIH